MDIKDLQAIAEVLAPQFQNLNTQLNSVTQTVDRTHSELRESIFKLYDLDREHKDETRECSIECGAQVAKLGERLALLEGNNTHKEASSAKRIAIWGLLIGAIIWVADKLYAYLSTAGGNR